MRRAGRAAGWIGLAALQVAIAYAYAVRGTWWHYLLHQYVGWGIGLSLAGLVAVARRRPVPVLPALLLGQLVSIFPDLMFRFLRMPHEPSMDWALGHISLHTGPSPLLVALAVLLLGGLGFLLCAARPALAVAACLAGPALLLVACLLAAPIPQQLRDYPGTASVAP